MRLTACFEEGILPEATSRGFANFLKLHVFGLPGLRACARVAKAVQIHARRIRGTSVVVSSSTGSPPRENTEWGSAMLKRSCAFAVFCSVSFLDASLWAAAQTPHLAVSPGWVVSRVPAASAQDKRGRCHNIGACAATGGTTVVHLRRPLAPVFSSRVREGGSHLHQRVPNSGKLFLRRASPRAPSVARESRPTPWISPASGCGGRIAACLAIRKLRVATCGRWVQPVFHHRNFESALDALSLVT